MPPKLWLRKDEKVWIIRDGRKQVRTGFGVEERRKAEESLRQYLNSKAELRPVKSDAASITIGEVLALYANDVGPEQLAPERTAYAIKALAPFWAHLTPSQITIPKRREYEQYREVSPSTVRRELRVLNAALNYAEKAIHLLNSPRSTLPKEAEPLDRWLTKDEIADLLSVSPEHLRRFITISVLTGRRKSAVLGLRWNPSPTNGWLDLASGMASFLGTSKSESSKRCGIIRMPDALSQSAQHWKNDGMDSVIHFNGKPIKDIVTTFNTACERCKIEDATPHTLKHTAVTWAFQNGMTLEDASDYFATSIPTLLKVYRQHSPHYQSRATTIMNEVGGGFIADNVADQPSFNTQFT